VSPQCDNCPLNGRPRVPPTGTPGKIAIVGEAPGRNEVAQGKPFVGISGKLLRQVMTNFGLNEGNTWITNACLCHPLGNETPPPEAIEACRPRLIAELKGTEKILLCGATPLAAFSPYWIPIHGNLTITSMRGIAVYVAETGSVVVPTFHPAWILRNPGDFTDLAKDLTKLLKMGIGPSAVQQPKLPRIHKCLTSTDAFWVLNQLTKSEELVIDIETTGFDPLTDRITWIGFQNCLGRTYQVPNHLFKDGKLVRLLLKVLLTSKRILTAGHGAASFDSKFIFYHYGIDWHPTVDTMLAHYCVDERRGTHGLKVLARERFNIPDYELPIKHFVSALQKERNKEYKDLGKKDPGKLLQILQEDPRHFKIDYGHVPDEMIHPYLAMDTTITYLLLHELLGEMEEEGTQGVHDGILLPAALALRTSELIGTRIDIPHLNALNVKLQKESDILEAEICQVARQHGLENFNSNSNLQVANLLFYKLRLPRLEGNSTKKEVVEELAKKHPVAKTLLEYRQKEKVRQTYCTGLVSRVSPIDNRVHPDFLLHGTVTGRISCEDPNLQNIPILIGPMIRDGFIAEDGWLLLEGDYNQLELKVAAYLSGDKKLCEYFQTGQDIHTMVATQVFGVPPEEIDVVKRTAAKLLNFGILYGRGAASVAHQLGCTTKSAQTFIDSFMRQFSELREWIESTQQSALTRGYVETPYGRKRRFALITSKNRAEVLRQAVNAPIQSTASDTNLSALIRISNRISPDWARVLFTVHDSLVLEVREGREHELAKIIQEEFVDNCPLKAPFSFTMSIKTGKRWGSLKTYESVPGRG